ncbi:MAG TPA: hypothetical protein VJR29_12550 [bacterium]|nr:hypothetical protein [bacterium]
MFVETDPVCRDISEIHPSELLCRQAPEEPLACSESSEAGKSYFEKSRDLGGKLNQTVRSAFAAEIFKSPAFSKPEESYGDPWAYSLGGLALSALGGLTGCSSTTTTSAPSAMAQGAAAILSSGSLRGRYDLLGDPKKYGTIYFYRQSYSSMPDMDPGLESLEPYRAGMEYQRHIVDSLELFMPKHVFVEDLPIDIPAGDREPLMNFIRDGLGDFKNFFSKHDLPSEREPNYFRLLAIYKQAALIYAYNHPEVALHRTIDPGESDELMDQLARVWNSHQGNPDAVRKDPEFHRLMFTLREAYAVREIMKFYKDHPGEDIALIFGKLHSFCDNFQAIGFMPRIASIWWDETTDTVAIPKACE